MLKNEKFQEYQEAAIMQENTEDESDNEDVLMKESS